MISFSALLFWEIAIQFRKKSMMNSRLPGHERIILEDGLKAIK